MAVFPPARPLLGACAAVILLSACGEGGGPGPNAGLGLAVAGGDGQVAVMGAILPESLVVSLTDPAGGSLEGVVVRWTVLSGGGTLSGRDTPTDAGGRAAVRYQLGNVLGLQTVRAEVTGGGERVTFSLRATGLAPSLTATVPIAPNYGIHDTFVRDGLAFVSAWNTGLLIYDVGDGRAGGSPSQPALVGSPLVTNGGKVHNVWWFHNPSNGEKRFAFVGEEGPGLIGASSSGDIHVVDLLGPNGPSEVGSYHMTGTAASAGTHNFWVDEAQQVLFAAYYNGGVVALDISGAVGGDLAGRELDRIQPGGANGTYVWGVMQHRGSLYASDMLTGLWQLRFTNGRFSVAGGGRNVLERYSSDLWLSGDYGYTGTWSFRGSNAGNVVKVWRLAANGAPALSDSVIVAGSLSISDVEVSRDGAVLVVSSEGGSSAGVHLYSLADPGRPVFISRWPSASGLNVHTVTLGDIGGRRYAFAARNPPDPALVILDITNILP